jgi:hypothetical protein
MTTDQITGLYEAADRLADRRPRDLEARGQHVLVRELVTDDVYVREQVAQQRVPDTVRKCRAGSPLGEQLVSHL